MLQHLPKRQKVIIMLAVMSGLFLAALDQTIVGTALPKILSEFNALKELSWVVTSYLLTSTIAVPIAGKLSDIYGRKKLLLAGTAVFIISSVLCGIATDIWQLIAFRALQGVGGGILFASAFTIIGDLFNLRERGKWQGIFGAVFGLSSLIGPLLGGYFTDANTLLGMTTSWRWAFLINVPVGLIAFGLIASRLPNAAAVKKPIIDYLGAATLSVGLAALVLACSLGGTEGWAWGSAQIIGMFALSAASLAAFVVTELKAKDPIIPPHLFHKKAFVLISILMLMFGMSFFGALIYLPTYAQQVLEFSATNSGILLLPMIIGLTISSILVGILINKTGKYKLAMVAGFILASIGIFTLTTLTTESTYWDLTWRMVLSGLGMGVAMPIISLVAQNSVSEKDLGVATSATQLFRSVGSTVGLAIMGGIMNNAITSRLTHIQDQPFAQMAAEQGQGAMFENFDINSIQGFLSEDARNQILSQLGNLPGAASNQAIAVYGDFVNLLQTVLSDSILQIFLISALVMVGATVISVFIKEEPLREGQEKPINPAH